MLSTLMRLGFCSLLVIAGLALGGCSAKQPKAVPAATCGVAGWCTEHGVPDDLCALCKPNVAVECRKKGDWCNQHNRPKSQCFLCDPKLEAKFVAEYEAKHGKKPPKSSEARP